MNIKIKILILIIALFLRLLPLVFFHGQNRAEKADAADIDSIAINVLNAKGFTNVQGEPTFTRAPLYPLFIAATYKVFGINPDAVKFLQALISTFSVFIIIFICEKLLFDNRLCILSGILAAIYPAFIIYSNVKLTETIFMFFLLLSCVVLISIVKHSKLIDFILLGFLHGISTLTRGTTLVFPGFFLLFVFFISKKKMFLRNYIIYLLIHFSIVSIWSIRNYRQFDTFLPVTVGSGHIMWLTLQDNVWNGDKLIEPDLEVMFKAYPETRGLPRYKWEGIVSRKTLMYAVENPIAYAKKIAINSYKLWQIPVGKVLLSENHKTLSFIYQITHFILIFLMFYGVTISISKIEFLPLNIWIVFFFLTHLTFIGIPRYRLPFEGFILILAIYGLKNIYDKLNLLIKKR